jgi:site-specific DNA recombinase
MTSVAIYARVSSARQKQDVTIASQTAALRAHAASGRLELPDGWVFEDEGHSGATLIRPALERLRDLVAGVGVDVVLCYSPDRLARKFAYQALLIEEFARAGTRVEFVKGPRGDSPEDALMVQFQGMFAEYEKAQIMERYRRGKTHRARTGSVNVLSGAPFGYRYVRKSDHVGAGYAIVEHEAALVVELFRRYADGGASIAELTRWLTESQVPTRTGKTRWDRSVVWGMLRNPAYAGNAVFGKTMTVNEPAGLNRRARLQGRGTPRTVKTIDRPRDEQITIAVPAIIDEQTFERAAVRLADNKRFATRNTKIPSKAWRPARAADTPTTAPQRAPRTRRSSTTGAWDPTTTATKAAGSAPTNRSAPTTSIRSSGTTSAPCSPTRPSSAPRSTADSSRPAHPTRSPTNANACTTPWPRHPPRSPG